MSIQIYNTMSRHKETFEPINPPSVTIYNCGPTVYDRFHIGNARNFIFMDVVRRWLEYRGYKVRFVQNLTDIDDKIINRARAEDLDFRAITGRYTAAYFEDAARLGVRKADVHPKATEHIGDIVKLIETLVARGLAYEAAGSVYFSVKSYKGYGKLSGRKTEDLLEGARVEAAAEKRDAADFALWKAAKPGEPTWESPWGPGRPGWHIECSAMAMVELGETIDIHAGGVDLTFPHHENEIAQSECATGKPFVHYWMHNGYINIDNKKMSKSEGNFFTVRDILKEFDPIAVRLFMLGSHYANPINFTRELIHQAEAALARIKNCRENLQFIAQNPKEIKVDVSAATQKVREDFISAMEDDLNTADAIGALYEYIRVVNTLFAEGGDADGAKKALTVLDELLDVLGLLIREEDIPEEISSLIEQRAAARAQKDWKTADMIRDRIHGLGYEVKDTPDGVKISKL